MKTSQTVVDAFATPEGRLVVLEREGDRYSIRIGDDELMASDAHGSETALAECAAAALAEAPSTGPLRVLIGGLGMGFTLRAALDQFPSNAKIEVAEVFEPIVEWCRGPLAHLAGESLSDPRAKVRIGDISLLLRSENGPYDAILLDIDNGPRPLTLAANTRIYSLHGLARLRASLRPGGVLLVWSAAPDRAFERRLGRSGFTVEVKTVRAHPKVTWPRHTLFLARRKK